MTLRPNGMVMHHDTHRISPVQVLQGHTPKCVTILLCTLLLLNVTLWLFRLCIHTSVLFE